MNVTVVYAISRLPQKYPDAWSKNKFHLKKGGIRIETSIWQPSEEEKND